MRYFKVCFPVIHSTVVLYGDSFRGFAPWNLDSEDIIMKSKWDYYLQAKNIAWNKFKELHPQEKWPKWLEQYLIDDGNTNRDNNWIFKILLQPQTPIPPDMHYELVDNVPMLVSYDEETGEREFVICGGPALEREVIFEVEIDLFHNSEKVIVDRGIDALERSKYVQIYFEEIDRDMTEYHISIRAENKIDLQKLRFITHKINCNLVSAEQKLKNGVRNMYQGRARVIQKMARELEIVGINYEISPEFKY